MEQAFKAVTRLVEDFRANERNYLSPTYQESHVRQDFIDKFFIALGWDVTHERQKNPHEYEVRIENRVNGGGTQQRADYAFFLGPNFRDPKFFVEAKKPARQLENPDFYYQTMRYGWNGNTPVAILTDFEELHVIDCRLKPTIKDAMSRRIKSFRYTDYADEEKFRWIYYLFSHEALADNSIDKFAEKLSKTKGKAVRGVGRSQPVDEVFLGELDSYRQSLAKAFKGANQELDGDELTEAVQRTIDRLVFIRFLEDKLVEEKEILNFGSRKLGWELFTNYCKKLEPKYNGLIFKPHPVIDSERFNPPGEEVFREICEGLAGRESPYNFDQIPISILGSIYERFLGKVVHATEKRAKIEDKPEVRKAGGVYYTPDYIVRYIVKETVGKSIEGKTPEEISKMAFADIACGSGSFLIEVYDTLLQYHERYYAEHPEKAKKGDVQQREGRKVLSLKKRQEILTNNIYGVDIDYQATEVTQLSLYLKLLEDVTTNDAYQFSLLKEKILPNLSRNIVCGNSLIGTDISEGSLFPDVDESKLKPMNFEDAFPEVMKPRQKEGGGGGGFDAVVGNPPYRILGGEDPDRAVIEYLSGKYSSFKYKADLFHLFIERAIGLLKQEGNLGYITPNTWYTLQFTDQLRQFVLSTTRIRKLLIFNHKVFKDANVDTSVSIFARETDVGARNANEVLVWNFPKEFSPSLLEMQPVSSSLQEEWQEDNLHRFETRILKNQGAILNRVWISSKPLEDTARASLGTQAYNSSKHTKEQIENRVFHSTKKLGKEYLKELAGNDIGRYTLEWRRKEWIKYGPWLHDYRTMEWLSGPRLLLREITGKGHYKICATYTEETYCNYKTILNVISKDETAFSMKYLLGILNSRLLSWLYPLVSNKIVKDSFPRLSVGDLKRLPIHDVDLLNPVDKARHDRIVNLVERMLAAKEELSKAKTEAETTRLERECESLDRQIDQAVYELYGLTEEEIKVVENV